VKLNNIMMAVGLVFVCTACSLIPEAKPIDFYTLQPASVNQSESVKLSHIRVAEPELNDVLQLERIVRITADGSILAYPNAKWSTSIATLWQNWMLDALWRDSRFEHISSSQQGFDSDWQVSGRLQAFHIEETNSGPVAVVRYDAQLVNTKQRKVTKSESFAARIPLSGDETDHAINALSTASSEVGERLLEWLAASSN